MKNKNDITGDTIITKSTSDTYRDNYDKIFRPMYIPTPELGQTIITHEQDTKKQCNKETGST